MNFLFNDLTRIKNYRCYQESSFDRRGKNDDYVAIKPGETFKMAEINGSGSILRIWLTIASPDAYILRNSLLKFYWDDESVPSVECPIGDFFGVGFGEYRHYHSAVMGMTSGGYYCYLPMPFKKKALLTFENQSSKKVNAFYYHITYTKSENKIDCSSSTSKTDFQLSDVDNQILYFHAKWKREKTERGKNYVILDAEGTGHYVGCNLSMQGKIPGSFWFLEGDEMIYVDDETNPSIHGTGTEDYFNSGWYFNKGEFHAPYHGLVIKDYLQTRICAYRFHIFDAVPFKKNIRVTIEHGGTNDTPGCDYSSTAYWYQIEPHKDFFKMLPPADRLPEEIKIKRNFKKAKTEVMNIGVKLFEAGKKLFT